MNSATTETEHVFEQAGLGKAPFRFVGFERKTFCAAPGAPVQAGGSCDYCSAAICNFCWILSADGRRFKVGPDCVLKSGDRGLKVKVSAAVAAHKKQLATARKARIAADVAAELPAALAALSLQPHPHPAMASRGLTRADWASWCLENKASLPTVLKVIRGAP